MVKITRFTAVNTVQVQDEGVSTTLEAEEAAIIELYEGGIRAVLDGQYADAEEAFRSVLSNNLVSSGTTEQLQSLRVLSNKNLAMTVSKQEGRHSEALVLFQQAIAENPLDVSLLDKFGTLAAKEGEWHASKDAFLHGLKIDMSHLTMRWKLLDILDHLHDHNARLSTFELLKHPGEATMRAFNDLPPSVDPGSEDQNTVMDGSYPEDTTVNVKDWTDLLGEISRLIGEYGMQGFVTVQVDKEILETDCNDTYGQDFECNKPFDTVQNSSLGNPEDGGLASGKEQREYISNQIGKSFLFDSLKDFFLPPTANLEMLQIEHKDKVPLYSLPRMHNVSLSTCSAIRWPVKYLCELILIYFARSKDLGNLSRDNARCLIKILENTKCPLSLECTLTLSEWLIEQFLIVKEDHLIGSRQPEALEEEMKVLDTMVEKMLAHLAVQAESCPWDSEDEEKCFNIRYLFAKGKKMQVLDKTDEAKEYLSACIQVLGTVDFGIHLLHLNSENIITAPRVRFNLESVDIHSEIQKVRVHPLEESGGQFRLDALIEKVLSGQREESFMLSVDSLGWSSILRELIDASIKSKDFKTCLRCQIRLLFVHLRAACEMENLEQGPLEFLEPLFTTTFMNFMMNSVQLEKILYCKLDDVLLDEYEKDMLRFVLTRLLVIMDSCHQVLVLDSSHAKSKYCKVLLSHTCAFFLGLLRFELQEVKHSMLIKTLDEIFEEIGRLGILLHRSSLVPYFSLPLLRQVFDRILVTSHQPSEVLEKEMEHMMMFAFDLSLSVNAEAGRFNYIDSPEMCRPRGITSFDELLFVWPLCETYLLSLSNQMLKRRACGFIRQCYQVAVSCLPQHVQASMLTSIEKCGLSRPEKICSSNMTSFVPWFKNPANLDPYQTMDEGRREGMLKIFQGIFNLKIRIDPLDMQSIQKEEGMDPLQVSDETLEANILPYVWNLAFNNGTIGHWQVLAEFHLAMYEWIISACLEEGRHPSKADCDRLIRHRNISYWCSCIAGKYADEQWKEGEVETMSELETVVKVFEFHGQALLNEITRLKSGHVDEGIQNGQEKVIILDNLEKAVAAYIAATRYAPSRYSNHMVLGVCMKQLGYPPKVYMSRLVSACKLGRQEHGALMDPLYELHASRLELLEDLWDPETNTLNSSNKEREEILDICIQSQFVGTMASNAPENELEKIQLLYADALQAMEWCLEVDKYFYKAIIKLATAKTSTIETRFTYWKSLFARGNESFVINMWPIREKGPRIQKAKAKKRKFADSKASFVIQSDAEQSVLETSTRFDDPNIRKPCVKTIGIGMNQIDRIDNHNLCIIRHALLSYVLVLKELQHNEILEEIIKFFEHVEDGIFKVPEYQDIIGFCKVCKFLITLKNLDDIIPWTMESFVNVSQSITHPMPSILLKCTHSMVVHLEIATGMYMKYLQTTKEDWIQSIVYPVAKYMLWRQKDHDTSDEIFAKILLTKKGISILELLSCVYVKLLTSQSKLDVLFSLYKDFMACADTESMGSSIFGMTLCVSALPAIRLSLLQSMKNQNVRDGKSLQEQCSENVERMSLYLNHALAAANLNNTMEDIWIPMQMEMKEKVIPSLKGLVHQAFQQQKRYETKNMNLVVRREEALASLGFVDAPSPVASPTAQAKKPRNQRRTTSTRGRRKKTQTRDAVPGIQETAHPEPSDQPGGIAAMAIRAVLEPQK